MKESDLFEPVKKLLMDKLKCTEVYGEVADADVLGLSGDLDIIVELKTSLNWKVIDQALNRQYASDIVYIGVPHSSTINHIALDTVRRYNLGLITVNKIGQAMILVKAPTVISKARRKFRDYVRDHHSKTIGGVKTGEGPTAYTETIVKIKQFMKDKDWVTAQEINRSVKTHYMGNATASIRDTLQARWNKDWCEWKKEGNRLYFRMKKTSQ